MLDLPGEGREHASSPARWGAALGRAVPIGRAGRLPVVHHLLATPPAYRYISTASNFFAFNVGLQVLVLVVAAGLAVGVTSLRQWRLARGGNG